MGEFKKATITSKADINAYCDELFLESETSSVDSWMGEEDSKTTGLHLVQAPYQLRRKNSSIFRDFLVSAGDPSDNYLPDIRLRTKNALIYSEVYIEDEAWGRPVEVLARTKNADLVLGIHTIRDHQAIRVRASTKNGRGRLFLPRDFKGRLAVSTKNGECTLTRDLRRVAVRVPNEFLDEKLCAPYDETPHDSPRELSNGVNVSYEINGDGPSFAVVDTKNGDVLAGFVHEGKVREGWTCCSVM